MRYELRFVEKHPERAKMREAKPTDFEAAMRARPEWTDRVGWSVTSHPSPRSRPFGYRFNRRLGGDASYS